MVSLFENYFSEGTATRVANKYDTNISHYKKTALCSSQSAVWRRRFLSLHKTEGKNTDGNVRQHGRKDPASSGLYAEQQKQDTENKAAHARNG